MSTIDKIRTPGIILQFVGILIFVASILMSSCSIEGNKPEYGLFTFDIKFHDKSASSGTPPWGIVELEVWEGIEGVENISISECSLVKPGYRLFAWNTKEDYSGVFVPLKGFNASESNTPESTYFYYRGYNVKYKEYLDLYPVWIRDGEDFCIAPINDKTASVVLYAGNAKTAIIPETINGYTITSVGRRFTTIVSLETSEYILPDTVTIIEPYAFYANFSNSWIKSVTLSKSLKTIGEYAFKGCQGLVSMTLPDSLKTIGKHAFEGCSKLVDMNLPPSVTSIGSWAFSDCVSWSTPLILPPGVTKVANGVFSYCESLPSIEFHAEVTELSESSFSGCENLKLAVFADKDCEFKKGEGILYNVAPEFKIRAPAGGSVEKFCKDNNIVFEL